MPKNKRELQVGDFVRVSKSSRTECVSGEFGMVCEVLEVYRKGEYGGNFYVVKDTNSFWHSGKINWIVSDKHLKYAKQANKKAGRNVAVK